MAVIKYYNQKELLYTSRKRYSTLSNFTEYAGEIQQKVLFGDGAKTSIKTKVSNEVATYVTIDDTRWFVVDHIYMNGGQITLHLLRDVIGEFGLNNCFGKVERGLTNNILKYRKELGLNQILKERKKIYPQTLRYGNAAVSSHNNELWGIFYFVKPKEDQKFDIPNLSIEANTDISYNANGYKSCSSFTPNIRLYFHTKLEFNRITGTPQDGEETWESIIYSFDINFTYNGNTGYFPTTTVQRLSEGSPFTCLYSFSTKVRGNPDDFAKSVCNHIANKIKNNNLSSFVLPVAPEITKIDYSEYNGFITQSDNAFYLCSSREGSETISGTISDRRGTTYLTVGEKVLYSYQNVVNEIEVDAIYGGNAPIPQPYFSNSINAYFSYLDFTEVGEKSLGSLTVYSNAEYVDEPFIIYAIPLFNTTITTYEINSGTETVNETIQVTKNNAFNVFNELISLTSGENPILVDAQIYPYAPPLSSRYQKVQDVPVFGVVSTSYMYNVDVSLQAYLDVKKEYTTRTYSVISPEQSNKFDFMYYDYTMEGSAEIEEGSDRNNHPLTFKIKTALKPYNIISSLVIQAEQDSLMGMAYESDLRGAQPVGGGFECSISTDQFQQYVRNNSNYNNMFELQKQELEMQHKTERKNERASSIVNTVSATMMGAIGGASMTDSIFGTGKIGAGIGAGIAGAAVGGAMTYQYFANEDLREYEEKLLQQRFNLEIGTIKNLPNSISRISSFNNILMNDFCYVIEVYECSVTESIIVDNYFKNYAYELGIYDYFINYCQQNNFIKGQLITSEFIMNLQNLASKELGIGIYYIQGGTQ